MFPLSPLVSVGLRFPMACLPWRGSSAWILLHVSSWYLLSTSFGELGRLGQSLHFSQFPLGLFLILCSGPLGHCSLVKLHLQSLLHHLLPLLAILLLCLLSVPQGRTPTHHLRCKANDLMLSAGSDTTLFVLPHRSPRNRVKRWISFPTGIVTCNQRGHKTGTRANRRFPPSRP